MGKYKYPYKHHFVIFIAFSLSIFLITCFVELKFIEVLKSYVSDKYSRINLLLYIFLTNLGIYWFIYAASKSHFDETGKNI